MPSSFTHETRRTSSWNFMSSVEDIPATQLSLVALLFHTIFSPMAYMFRTGEREEKKQILQLFRPLCSRFPSFSYPSSSLPPSYYFVPLEADAEDDLFLVTRMAGKSTDFEPLLDAYTRCEVRTALVDHDRGLYEGNVSKIGESCSLTIFLGWDMINFYYPSAEVSL